jgi:hypothetical protein
LSFARGEPDSGMSKDKRKERAVVALKYIMPFLEKYDFKWCISGGLACHIYGVDRPITAIDIDIETTKDDPRIKSLASAVKEFITLPFQLWIDKNYDNWVMDVTVNGQLLSICTTQELKLFNKETSQYELFYKNGIPEPNIVDFGGLKLPLSPKQWTLKMKKALAHMKPIDKKDISEMEQIVKENE